MIIKTMHRAIHFLLIISAVMIINGCKTAPVYNIEDSQFTTSTKVSHTKVKQAILKGCNNTGWQAKSLRHGKILATYSTRNNKFSAAIIIDYDKDSYSIHYLKSSNLKYNRRLPDSQGGTEQNFFEQLIPTKNSAKSATIHKVYNSWVKKLQSSIDQQLSTLNLGQTYSSTQTSSRYSSTVSARHADRALHLKASCSTKPSTILSGNAYIKSSRVNLRAGSSTKCSIIGTLSTGAKVALLGKQGKWYYIQQENGSNAWIYNTLISLDNASANTAHKVTASNTSQPVPRPPTPPSKKISIAVIQFKTLNKEAKDISLGELISESFTTALVNSNSFKIIEREQLDKVVQEMEMTQTGFIETTNAVEIGKMLHADAIITGSVALLNNQIQLNARIIEIESAYVIGAESATTHYSLSSINQAINTIVNSLSYKLMTSKTK